MIGQGAVVKAKISAALVVVAGTVSGRSSWQRRDSCPAQESGPASRLAVLTNEFQNAFDLVTYWRDEAAHRGATSITPVQSIDALDRLCGSPCSRGTTGDR